MDNLYLEEKIMDYDDKSGLKVDNLDLKHSIDIS
jgi:hypothetical protein